MEKIDGYINNLEKSSTAKVSEHIPSAFSMSTTLSFKEIKNKYDVYKSKDGMKNFCESKRKKLELLTNKLYENVNICYTCKK